MHTIVALELDTVVILFVPSIHGFFFFRKLFMTPCALVQSDSVLSNS